ncbi:hypothetical protein FRC03_001265 [Tulasnella sp. 419]|nr:hypothetical protein FRC03_001265 [Tulasnella sp. 419]
MSLKGFIISLSTILLVVVNIGSPVNAAPSVPNLLRRNTTLQIDANGNEFQLASDGSWTMKMRELGSSNGVNARDFSWTYCTGNFAPYHILGDILEFGGQQTCNDPKTWPQSVTVRLESTCDSWLCIKFTEKGTAKSGEVMGSVATAHDEYGCEGHNTRKYRMVVRATANGGVQVGPFFDDETDLACG